MIIISCQFIVFYAIWISHINAKDKKGKTVIEYIEEGHTMVKFLKSHGATASPIIIDEKTKQKRLEEKKRREEEFERSGFHGHPAPPKKNKGFKLAPIE